jgi:hypothetical protein
MPEAAMKRLVGFIITCVAAIALVLGLIWVGGGFSGYGADRSMVLAVVLGILFTSLLGVGLMALVFYSNRSGRDRDVARSGVLENRDGREL